MIRKVAFRKALFAGAAGAAAWEATARILSIAGFNVFDIVQTLGTLLFGDAPVQLWWPAGMILHAGVGAIWATLYAYFFWSSFHWRPALQGLAFAPIQTVLAGLVMVPQLGWMNPQVVTGAAPHPGVFAWQLGLGGPFMIVIGHVIYGITMGALYTRPVGYAADRKIAIATRDRRANARLTRDGRRPVDNSRFIFATGIESSCPTIDGGKWRIDQMLDNGHYRRWRDDLELVSELGVTHLRYGPPLHHVWLGSNHYEWGFVDDVMSSMREQQITPIVDLCHFGVPNWIGNFQNRDFPSLFADYAAAFAARYRDVTLFTPINEMYVTARMSGLDGVWNEQLKSERGFVTAAFHVAKASALAARAIVREQHDALFINSESGEFFQACCPDAEIVAIADFENERRFVPLDLLYGVAPSERMRQHLFANGLRADEYDWLMRNGSEIAARSILGIDYYDWNEKLIASNGRPEALGELFGWYVITKQYFDRYQRPLMHTETNSQDAKVAPDWLWRQWHNVQLMRRNRIPVVGFTWYSLIDQIDWDISLREPLGNVNPVGLYDFNRDPRPVAESYRRLIKMFRDERLSATSTSADLHQVVAASRPRARHPWSVAG
jgi:beta-glucosidase/6-phospho-beta-glucosidase/beta-galactosidase